MASRENKEQSPTKKLTRGSANAMAGNPKNKRQSITIADNSQMIDSLKGAGGEQLYTKVNETFLQIIPIIHKYNGDIIKFAGDAVIVLYNWKAIVTDMEAATVENEETLRTEVMRACLCSLTLTSMFKGVTKDTSVHIGVSCGELISSFIGGVFDRWEYVIAGEPLEDISFLLEEAKKNQCVVSPKVHEMSKMIVMDSNLPSGNWLLLQCTNNTLQNSPEYAFPECELKSADDRVKWVYDRLDVPDISRIMTGDSDSLLSLARCVTPKPLLTSSDSLEQDENSELLRVSVMFVSITGIQHTSKVGNPYDKLQQVCKAVQSIIYDNGGFLRQMCVDDKGTVIIGVFPSAEGGVGATVSISDAIHYINRNMEQSNRTRPIMVAVGLATGTSLCANVGDQFRGEYAVVGDVPVRAARLMGHGANQLAEFEAEYRVSLQKGHQALPFPTLCDSETEMVVEDAYSFSNFGCIPMKGKSHKVQVYRPSRRPSEDNKKSSSFIIGRTGELKFLSEAMDSLLYKVQDNGKILPTVMIVRGTEGVGKSLFLKKGAELNTFLTLHVALSLQDSHVPYGAFKSLLQLMVEWGSTSDSVEFTAKDSSAKLVNFLEIIKTADATVRSDENVENANEFPPRRCKRSFSEIYEAQVRSREDSGGQTAPNCIKKTDEYEEAAKLFSNSEVGEWLPLLVHILPYSITHKLPEPNTKSYNGRYLDSMFIEIIRLFVQGIKVPLYVTIDDAHWGDEKSWRVLSKIANEGIPILWGLAMSSTVSIDDSGAGAVYERITTLPQTTVFTLKPFTKSQVIEFTQKYLTYSCSSVPDNVWTLVFTYSLGNPFIVREMIGYFVRRKLFCLETGPLNKTYIVDRAVFRMLKRFIPDSVDDLLSKTLDRLQSSELVVAKICSVIGRYFDLSLAKTVHQTITGMQPGIRDFDDIVLSLVEKGLFQPAYLGFQSDARFLSMKKIIPVKPQDKKQSISNIEATLCPRKSTDRSDTSRRFSRVIRKVIRKEVHKKSSINSTKSMDSIPPSSKEEEIEDHSGESETIEDASAYLFPLLAMQENIYSRIPHLTRKMYHEVVAKCIQLRYIHNLDLFSGSLAYHWGAANNPEKEVFFLQELGQLLLRSMAYQEAIGVFSHLIEYQKLRNKSILFDFEQGRQIRFSHIRKAEWQFNLGCALHGVGSRKAAYVNFATSLSIIGTTDPTGGKSFLYQLKHIRRMIGAISMRVPYFKMDDKIEKWPPAKSLTATTLPQKYDRMTLLKANIFFKLGQFNGNKELIAICEKMHKPLEPPLKKSMSLVGRSEMEYYVIATTNCLVTQTLSSELGQAYALLAWSYHTQGKFDTAESFYRASIRVCECIFNPVMLLRFTLMRVNHYILIGKFENVQYYLDQALSYSRNLEDDALKQASNGMALDFWLITGQLPNVYLELQSNFPKKESREFINLDFRMLLRSARIASIYSRPYDAMLLVNRAVFHLQNRPIQGEEMQTEEMLQQSIDWSEYPTVAVNKFVKTLEISQLEDWNNCHWGGRTMNAIQDGLVSSTSATLNARFINFERCEIDLKLTMKILPYCIPEVLTIISYIFILDQTTEAILIVLSKQSSGSGRLAKKGPTTDTLTEYLRVLLQCYILIGRTAPIVRSLRFLVAALHSECVSRQKSPTSSSLSPQRKHSQLATMKQLGLALKWSKEHKVPYSEYLIYMAHSWVLEENPDNGKYSVLAKATLHNTMRIAGPDGSSFSPNIIHAVSKIRRCAQ